MFFKKSSRKYLCAFSLVLSYSVTQAFFGYSSAYASTEDKLSSIESTVELAIESARESFPELVLEPKADSGVGKINLGAGYVDVPKDLNDGIDFVAPTGDSVAITPKFVAKAKTSENGVATYLNEEEAQSVIVGDLGVQILTTIVNEKAATEYVYELELEKGEQIKIIDGSAVVLDSEDNVVLAFAAPWALDADGKEIPTWYEVKGNSLIQVINHTMDNVAYPVVADPIVIAPWALKCLIGLGLKGPEIARIMYMGTPATIAAAFGRAAVACIFWK